LAICAERMVLRHDDLPMPRVDRQQHEVREFVLAAGVDGEVDAIERRHLGDLVGRALVQVQLHVGIFLAEVADHARQHVARLRVRRADGQRTAIGLLEVLRQALERLRLAQHAQRARRHFFAAGVRRLSARPSRTNSVRPSSSSSRRICLLTPGWEVCSAWAAVVTLRPFCTTAARYRSCCSFKVLPAADSST
jgi:hypothetical protein